MLIISSNFFNSRVESDKKRLLLLVFSVNFTLQKLKVRWYILGKGRILQIFGASMLNSSVSLFFVFVFVLIKSSFVVLNDSFYL